MHFITNAFCLFLILLNMFFFISFKFHSHIALCPPFAPTYTHQPSNCLVEPNTKSLATIPDDFGITRISGLTWDQWNAHLVAPKPTPDEDTSLPATPVAPLPNHSLLFSSTESSCSPTGETGAQTPRVDHLHREAAGDFDDSIYTPIKMEGMTALGGSSAVSGPGSAANGGQGEFPCPDCGRFYKLKSSLRNHQKWECGKEPQFQCPFCAYRAKQKMHIGRHLERMHKDIVHMDFNKAPFLKELFMASGELKKSSGNHDRKKKRRSPTWASPSTTPKKGDTTSAITTGDLVQSSKSDNIK